MGIKVQINDIDVKHKEYDRCLRCGRKLKSPENRLRGYGKICYEKIKNKHIKPLI